MWAFGGSVRSSCIVGTTFIAASRRITYLPSHLCLRVCARSSPFVPYHAVLVTLFPYPQPFVCCLLWCHCTPYSKRDVRGWGPSFLFLSLLPGGSHTFVGLGWWRGPGARCSSRVRGVARHGNILAWLPLLPLFFLPVMRVLSTLCSLLGCNILISPTSLRVSCVAASLYSLCKWACGRGGFVVPWHRAIAILGWSHTLAVVWYVTYLCVVRVLPSPLSYRVVLVTAYLSVGCLA